MNAWRIYLNGKIIDTVYFIKEMTAKEIYQALVSHDNYNPNIVVRKVR